MLICPNTNSKEWKQLVSNVGEEEAWRLFAEYDDIPVIQTSETKIDKANTKPDELKESLNKLAISLGLDIQSVDKILDAEGKEVSALAKASILNKTIQYLEGFENQLPEEIVHFAIEAMDSDNPLYQAMYNRIDKFDVYNRVVAQYSDLYGDKPNAEALYRKEAMGQLLLSVLRGEQVSQNKEYNEYAGRFLTRVVDFLRRLFTGSSINQFRKEIVDIAPFSKVAEAIMERNFDIFSESNLTEDIELYSNNRFNLKLDDLTDTQKEVVAKIIDFDKRTVPSTDKHSYEHELPNGKKLSALSTVSSRGSKMTAVRTELQKKQDELGAAFGTNAHGFMELAAKIVFNKADKSLLDKTYPELVGVKESVLNFLNTLKAQFPEGSVFLPEVRVFDIETREGGTVDLIIVEPDGKINNIDYKFQNFGTDAKKGVISFFKMKNWNKQTAGYQQILSKITGSKNFGRNLIIPGSMKGSTDMNGLFIPTSFEIGRLDNKAKTFKSANPKENDYLDPVALRTDVMDDTTLQEYVSFGEELLLELEGKIKNAIDEERTNLANKINKLHKSLNKLKVENNVQVLEEFLNEELRRVEADVESFNVESDNSPISFSYEKYASVLKLAEKAEEVAFDAKDLTEEQRKKLQDIRALASRLGNKILKLETAIVKKQAKGELLDDNLEVVKADTTLGSTFENMSKSENKFVNLTYQLFENARIKIQDKNRKDIERITEFNENFKKIASTKGLSLQEAFNKLLDRNEKGDFTGRLLRVWSKEFFEQRKLAIQNGNIDWFLKNTSFDAEAYQKAYDAKKKSLEKRFEKYKNKKEIIEKELSDYAETFDVRLNNSAYLGKNKFVKALDKWQSKEWLELNKPENKWLKDYYDFFTKTIQDLELPVYLSESFIPKIEKQLIESMVRGNFLTTLKDGFMGRSREDFANYNDDGSVKREIPLYYIDSLAETAAESAALQSYDLSKILAVFTTMGNNFKYKNEIENQVLTVRNALKAARVVPNGTSMIDKAYNAVKKTTDAERTLSYLNTMIDAEIYGIKTLGEKFVSFKREEIQKDENGIPLLDDEGNVIKKQITTKWSTDRILLKNKMFSSLLFLSGNLLSIFANAMGGQLNVVMLASKGRFFTKKQLLEADKLIITNDAKELRSHFDLFNTQDVSLAINKLSSSKLVGLNLVDKAMIAQRKTDEFMTTQIMLALSKNYTVKDGLLVKVAKGEKSLFDLSKEGKIAEIIPKNSLAYKQLRQMSYGLTEKAIGNSSREQLNIAKLRTSLSLLTHLRSWVVSMARERGGQLAFDRDLNTYDQGKFISTFKTIVRDGYLNSLKNLPLMFFNVDSKVLEANIEKIYYDYQTQGVFDVQPMSLEEFKEMYKGNLRASRMEFLMYSALILAMFGLKPDDDDNDEEKRIKKFIISYVNRTANEVGFFISPASAKEVLKRTIMIPSFSTFYDVPTALGEGVHYSFEKLMGDEKIDSNPEKLLKMLPIARGAYNVNSSILEMFED